MEPKWNVKALNSFIGTAGVSVLMEPKWNVKDEKSGDPGLFSRVLMEPKWNVKPSGGFLFLFDLGINGTKVECKASKLCAGDRLRKQY